MKTVWVDLLCWSSVLRIFFLSRIIAIDKIYYISRTKYLSNFFTNILVRLVKKPVVQMDWVAEGDEKIDGISLYETIQLRLKDILDKWVSKENIFNESQLFCEKYKYNLIKFKEHVKEAAYEHIFRLVEISVLAEKISGKENSLFILRNSPFNKAVLLFLKAEQVRFYNTWLLSYKFVEKRKEYFYDGFLSQYFSNRIRAIWSIWVLYLSPLVSSVLCKLLRKNIPQENIKNVNIGAELITIRIRLNENNDLYWLKDSSINPKTVWGIEHNDYDQKSKDALNTLGIRRCKIIKNPFRLFAFKKYSSDSTCRYLTIGVMDSLKIAGRILRLTLSALLWNEFGWIQSKKATYVLGTSLWESIYKQLNIRIFWSMHDIDPNKLVKAQAIENLGGLYIGSHWSNHPMCRVDVQKCYDVLFAWGAHFEHDLYRGFPYMAVFQVGYPSDFYFEEKRASALKISNKYPGKFIVSFQDNIMAYDLMYSKNMHLQIYKMFLSIIENNPNFILFLKPKYKWTFDKILLELPELQQAIDKGRVEVFLGDTPWTKAVPATVGMASHLVIGLGISSAAAECFFAGTVAFHAEFTGFERNTFAQEGLNKIVFRDVESLEHAIYRQIEGEGVTVEECKPYYESLDSFQDGKAYIRTGYTIKRLQEKLQTGYSRENAVKQVKDDYQQYLTTFLAASQLIY